MAQLGVVPQRMRLQSKHSRCLLSQPTAVCLNLNFLDVIGHPLHVRYTEAHRLVAQWRATITSNGAQDE